MNEFSPKNISTLARIANLAWWIYVVVILSLFFIGLLLNYIVKKINEVRLANRFISLHNKASASRSTQVQRPIELDSRPRTLTTHSENLNAAGKGISLIFNKEENLLEDKRRKDLDKNSDENAPVVADTSSIQSAKDEDLGKSVFLGRIYKDLFETRAAIENSKSLSNIDRDSILNEIVDKMVWKINESKSTPSIKKLLDIQNEKDLKDWALDSFSKRDEETLASTSVVSNK